MNRRTNSQVCLVFILAFTLACAWLVRADDPTSKFVSLAPIGSTLAPSSTGVAVQFEIWDQATGGTMIFSEAHTVDTDASSNISNDTNFADLLLGRPNGLNAANFPNGSSRYLDVTQGGMSVLTARLPLYASVFSLTDPGSIPGNLTMVNSTATAGNVVKGGVLFLHNFGTNNTFLGQNAGNLTMSGRGSNTAVGAFALSSNTTGDSNTASGASALQNNTTGSQNTASGHQALQNNTAGGNNTAIGHEALLRNTTGRENTASGAAALVSNTTGSDNTASGYLALLSNTTGDANTASGGYALQSNTTGEANTASGYQALFRNTTGRVNTASGYQALVSNTTGSDNTASGYSALGSNTTGSSNTAIGESALSSNTTGNSNTAIGTRSDVSVGNLTNATAIGAGAIVNASNKIRLGNTAVTLIEGQGDFYASGPGNGIILKSPNGAVCRRLSIDNTGALVTTAVACP